ncbi:MAG: hypothetical protein JNL02_09590 [Saprospiraceae bacterium]|nr:hypothetical protein [Saprospiraceae bacterium]
MPVEIKKLIIQAKVSAPKSAPAPSGKQEVETEQIIEACVKAVLKILEKQKLR